MPLPKGQQVEAVQHPSKVESGASGADIRHSPHTLSENSWWFTSCMTQNADRCRFFRFSGLPFNAICPACSRIRPHRHRERVVFPTPLGPVMATTSPGRAEKDRSWKTGGSFR